MLYNTVERTTTIESTGKPDGEREARIRRARELAASPEEIDVLFSQVLDECIRRADERRG